MQIVLLSDMKPSVDTQHSQFKGETLPSNLYKYPLQRSSMEIKFWDCKTLYENMNFGVKVYFYIYIIYTHTAL